MHDHPRIETSPVSRARNTELEVAILRRLALVCDLTRTACGVPAKSMYRWLLRDDITVHYATVHRACQRLVSDGLIEYVDGTTELVPTDKGRQTLVTNTLQ